MKDFAEMNGEYEKWFKHKPARTCVAVYQLPKGVPVSEKLGSAGSCDEVDGMYADKVNQQVEIEAIALQ